jgi:hypothetical protein
MKYQITILKPFQGISIFKIFCEDLGAIVVDDVITCDDRDIFHHVINIIPKFLTLRQRKFITFKEIKEIQNASYD